MVKSIILLWWSINTNDCQLCAEEQVYLHLQCCTETTCFFMVEVLWGLLITAAAVAVCSSQTSQTSSPDQSWAPEVSQLELQNKIMETLREFPSVIMRQHIHFLKDRLNGNLISSFCCKYLEINNKINLCQCGNVDVDVFKGQQHDGYTHPAVNVKNDHKSSWQL